MTSLVLVASLLAAAPADGGAPPDMDKSPEVEAIRKRYADTNTALASLTAVKKPVSDCSLEGGELTLYLEQGRVRRAVMKLWHEMGRESTELYFFEGALDFVYSESGGYGTPLSGKFVWTAEHRYYFAGGNLIWWVTGKDRKPAKRAEYPSNERELLAEARAVLAAAGAKAKGLKCVEGEWRPDHQAGGRPRALVRRKTPERLCKPRTSGRGFG